MKLLKRTLCIFLSVLILFFGVSNSYFSPHKMDEAHAMGATYMTYETMQAICYYLGSLFLGYSASAEIPNLTDEEIKQAGHSFIKSMYDVSGVNPFISDQLADITQPLFTLISNKQAYVFGTEALKEVAETEFTVIMGGGNNDDNDDDNDDEEKKTKIDIKEIGKTLGALSVQGVALFSAVVKYQLDQYNNDAEGSILADTASKYFTGYQINDAGQYVYTGNFADVYRRLNYEEIDIYITMNLGTFTSDYPLVAYINPEWGGISATAIGLKSTNNVIETVTRPTATQIVQGSRFGYQIDKNGLKTVTVNESLITNYPYAINYTWGTAEDVTKRGEWNAIYNYSTLPIYPSLTDATTDINNGVFDNALNNAKTYKIADWLQDDWTGDLVDPLTGLSYLDDLAQLAKQLGLSGLGDNPDLVDIKKYLRDILQNINQHHDPDTNPLVDPALDPIPYPSTLPVPVIDPTSPIVVQPVADPEPAPSTNPDPQPSTDPVTDPDEVPEELEDIVDEVPAIADDLGGVVDTFKKKFPFSIPWDIYYILNGLATTPKAPYFELPLKVERYGINETIIVDMSRFQVLSDLSRSIFSMLFMIVLINLTIKVIGSIKEES